MAGIDEELHKPTEEPGLEPKAFRQGPIPDELAENGGSPKAAQMTDSAAGPPPGGEPPSPSRPESESPKDGELELGAPAQESTPDVDRAAAEAQGFVAPLVQPPAAKPVKPRSLFPALAATAFVGALLGLGGSYGLRLLEGARTSPGQSAAALDGVNARLEAIEGKIEGKEAAASAAAPPAVAALESRVAAVEEATRKAAELAQAANAAAQQAAAGRAETKEFAGESAAPSEMAGFGPLEARLAAVEQKLAEAASRAPSEMPDLGPLEARLAAVEQKLAQTAPEAAPKLAVRAAPGRESRAAAETARAQQVAIVAENLLRKIDHGEEFSSELDALENLGVSQSAAAPLRAAAGSAVASERELAAQFGELSGKMIAAGQAAPAGQGESLLDVLTRNAKSWVNVRRVGDSSGADVQSVVGRIESAVADHDLNAAYNSFEELPAAAKDAGRTWGEAVKLRLDALNAAKAIEAEAVAILAKPKH